MWSGGGGGDNCRDRFRDDQVQGPSTSYALTHSSGCRTLLTCPDVSHCTGTAKTWQDTSFLPWPRLGIADGATEGVPGRCGGKPRVTTSQHGVALDTRHQVRGPLLLLLRRLRVLRLTILRLHVLRWHRLHVLRVGCPGACSMGEGFVKEQRGTACRMPLHHRAQYAAGAHKSHDNSLPNTAATRMTALTPAAGLPKSAAQARKSNCSSCSAGMQWTATCVISFHLRR